QIGNGRLGFNLVAGMSASEIELLDAPRIPHDDRYLAADEFTTILKRAWTETEPFDFAGRYFRTTRGWVSPKPVQQPYPVLVNAGLSEAGREFAARVCDWSFINPPNVKDLEQTRPLTEDLKSRAARHGKSIRLLTQALIFSQDTDAAAEAYYQWVIDSADDRAVAAWQDASRRAVAAGLTQDTSRFASDRAKGEGRVFVSGLPVVGSPQTLVDRLIELRRVGIDGVHLGFLDYDELDYFGAKILPLMQEAGLR
ncbi:MAG TPA: LLM class flavin-dependent oxidoreductase, partial [Dehalococcoidia bacterium]|nr:LLM class flavin-dependent oxidoreductase [Dehalococcoidia bacterium]